MDPLADIDLPETALVSIAASLREMREKCGWSREELAQMAGVPVDLIRGYEADPASLTHATLSQVLEAMMTRDQAERTEGHRPDPLRPSVEAQMEAGRGIPCRRLPSAQALRAPGLRPAA
jgi:ribosome-binding protein aMBF1 (putative translation factor)